MFLFYFVLLMKLSFFCACRTPGLGFSMPYICHGLFWGSMI